MNIEAVFYRHNRVKNVVALPDTFYMIVRIPFRKDIVLMYLKFREKKKKSK